MVGSTTDTLPTKPRSAWRGAAVMRLASSPDIPTASGPCTLMAETMSRLTLPTSTMRAMSSVSASVTRSPLRNSVSLPSRAISSPIWGPPPCTTTGSMPTARMSTTSSANEASASPGSVRPRRPTAAVQRVAAVLDDDDLLPEAPDVGQRLHQHRGRLGRRRLLGPGDLGRHGRAPVAAPSRRRPVLVDVAVAEVGPEHDRLARRRARGRSRARCGGPPCGPPPPRVVRHAHAAGAHHGAAVGERAPGRCRRASRPSRARRRCAPSRGPRRRASTARAWSPPPCGPPRAPPRRSRAPRTCTCATLVAPSASSTICSASDRQASVQGGGQTRPATALAPSPLASTSTVSLVEVQPSTVIVLNEAATASRSAACSVAGVDGGVGRADGEHGGHVRRQHGGALGHAADGEPVAGDDDLLGHGVGRHDGLGGLGGRTRGRPVRAITIGSISRHRRGRSGTGCR